MKAWVVNSVSALFNIYFSYREKKNYSTEVNLEVINNTNAFCILRHVLQQFNQIVEQRAYKQDKHFNSLQNFVRTILGSIINKTKFC